MIKVILYHPGQYAILKDETYKVCESTYGFFEILSYKEDFPFRDEASVELFDTINALQLFKALIPDILRREMILCG